MSPTRMAEKTRAHKRVETPDCGIKENNSQPELAKMNGQARTFFKLCFWNGWRINFLVCPGFQRFERFDGPHQ